MHRNGFIVVDDPVGHTANPETVREFMESPRTRADVPPIIVFSRSIPSDQDIAEALKNA